MLTCHNEVMTVVSLGELTIPKCVDHPGAVCDFSQPHESPLVCQELWHLPTDGGWHSEIAGTHPEFKSLQIKTKRFDVFLTLIL